MLGVGVLIFQRVILKCYYKSLFTSKFYFPQVKIIYLHMDHKLGTLFAPRETLVLETQFLVKFSITFAPSPLKINKNNNYIHINI